MAIEVISQGHLPEKDQFEATCRTCKSEIRFLRSDGKVTFDQRDGDFISVSCPVCGNALHVDVKKGKAPPPRPNR